MHMDWLSGHESIMVEPGVLRQMRTWAPLNMHFYVAVFVTGPLPPSRDLPGWECAFNRMGDVSPLTVAVLHAPLNTRQRVIPSHEPMAHGTAWLSAPDVIVMGAQAASEGFPFQIGSHLLSSVYFSKLYPRQCPLAPLPVKSHGGTFPSGSGGRGS